LDDIEKQKWIEFGKYIRNVRKEKKISAYMIEQKYDFNRQYWYRIELATHGYAIKPELIIKMAEILEINYLELYKIVNYVSDDYILDYCKTNLMDKLKENL